MKSQVDILAAEYMIDHGLKKPRPGDFTIMKKLQKDLLKEQDENLGGDREEMAKKWAGVQNSAEAVYDTAPIIERLFSTPDLYTDMMEADDAVTAERANIYHAESILSHASGDRYTEHYYSTTITYHINLYQHLQGRGTHARKIDETAMALAGMNPQFQQYIDSLGGEDMLDKWLPGTSADLEFDLDWTVKDVFYRPRGMVDVVIDVSERWLTDAE